MKLSANRFVGLLILVILVSWSIFTLSKDKIASPEQLEQAEMETNLGSSRTDSENLPEKALAHFKKGREFLQARKLDPAIIEFESALRYAPDSPLVHFWMGKTYDYKGEHEKAIARLKKVLELDSRNVYALATIGRILSKSGTKLDEAIDYLKQALDVNPSHADARFDLARIYALKGDIKSSLTQFGIIFRTEPKYALYHFELGKILESLKEKERAKQEYQRALDLDPKLDRAREALDRLQ